MSEAKKLHINDTALSHLMRHTVCFSTDFIHRDFEQTRFAAFPGFVVSLNETWWVATAGHNILDFIELKQLGAIEDHCTVMADYFHKTATSVQPIPMDPFDGNSIAAYNESTKIDFALVPVNSLVQQNLIANGIIPIWIDTARTTFDDFEESDSFFVIGFPEDSVVPRHDSNFTGGYVKPSCVPLRPMRNELTSKQSPRFVGRILDMGALSSVKGMSGGPIVRIRQTIAGFQYEAIAIQSTWDSVNRDRVFGCPIFVCLDAFASALEIVVANLPSGPTLDAISGDAMIQGSPPA